MNPATDLDAAAAVERFGRLPEDERAAILAAGRLIQSVDDLEGLPESVAARLRPILDEQSPAT